MDNNDYIDNPLSPAEREEFEILNQVVTSGLKSVFDVGRALKRINEARLYRERYRTFEEYCEQVHSIGRGDAYHYMKPGASEAAIAVVAKKLPENIYQLRPLEPLTIEQGCEAWQEAERRSGEGRVTHKIVKDVVADMRARSKSAAAAIERPPVVLADADDTEYLFGDTAEILPTLEPASFDLLLVSDLGGSTASGAASRLGSILADAGPAMRTDCHALVVTRFGYDPRPLFAAAEAAGFEVGVSSRWLDGSKRQPVAWSTTMEGCHILHLRRGSAALAGPLSDLIECEPDTFKVASGVLPVPLVTALIEAATQPGGSVLDPAASAATTVIACRGLGRRCVAIEGDAERYRAGTERLARHGGLDGKGVAA